MPLRNPTQSANEDCLDVFQYHITNGYFASIKINLAECNNSETVQEIRHNIIVFLRWQTWQSGVRDQQGEMSSSLSLHSRALPCLLQCLCAQRNVTWPGGRHVWWRASCGVCYPSDPSDWVQASIFKFCFLIVVDIQYYFILVSGVQHSSHTWASFDREGRTEMD